ncbi:hypothetical protein [Desmonostoc muscorum]|nr:hypothetical protein [Desmonostoc muscorum]
MPGFITENEKVSKGIATANRTVSVRGDRFTLIVAYRHRLWR